MFDPDREIDLILPKDTSLPIPVRNLRDAIGVKFGRITSEDMDRFYDRHRLPDGRIRVTMTYEQFGWALACTDQYERAVYILECCKKAVSGEEAISGEKTERTEEHEGRIVQKL